MLYAAYGSNLHPGRLGERLASARLLGTSALPGWDLTFRKRSLDGSGKCTIHADGSRSIFVAVFEVEAAEMSKLDEIEGLGIGYERAEVDVPGHGLCNTYVGIDLDESLAPYDWYQDLVVAGCRYHRFPSKYVETVSRFQNRSDPQAERALQNRRLLERLSLA